MFIGMQYKASLQISCDIAKKGLNLFVLIN